MFVRPGLGRQKERWPQTLATFCPLERLTRTITEQEALAQTVTQVCKQGMKVVLVEAHLNA